MPLIIILLDKLELFHQTPCAQKAIDRFLSTYQREGIPIKVMETLQ